MSFPAMISQLGCSSSEHSSETSEQPQIWREISGLQIKRSSPLSIGGSLFAVGGEGEDHNAVTAIHLYRPVTGDWVKVGDLPTPRYDCTCVMIKDKEMIVAGGEDDENLLRRCDIALISS